MFTTSKFTASKLPRRRLLSGLAAWSTLMPALMPISVRAQGVMAEGVVADSDADQSAAVQAAMDKASAGSGRLVLPGGRIRAAGLSFPSHLIIEGVPGRTRLEAMGAGIGRVAGGAGLRFRDLEFAGESGEGALIALDGAKDIVFERCRFADSPGVALSLSASAALIRDCVFSGHGDAAIHALDCHDLSITGCSIADCGNAGIRVWRSQSGPDGAMILANRIAHIDWRGGGNGQNGNGINIFRAGEVIIADNHIEECAFSAIRLNGTENCQVTGNVCRDLGEVAIFSEFGFSGSLIAHNIVAGAAAGISITNLDAGGRLAVCANNIVRDIAEKSAVNPDTVPVGIFAEAEVAVSGNLVSAVPGVAIGAGWGPYLRNVAITGNVIADSAIGIGVSLVEGAGPVLVADNLVSGTTRGDIVGLRWSEIAEPDLAAVAARYAHVTIR